MCARRSFFQKALKIEGFRFFLIHSPCPTGWKSEPAESIELVSLAVRSGIFPVYEVFDGEDYRINVEPDGTDPARYFKMQRRFTGTDVDLDAVRDSTARNVRRLKRLATVP